jgi:glycosyltransferase involved in cell wall biosynthesis
MKVKVLMVHDFADLPGGANQYRLRLTDLLRQMGIRVTLFTFSAGADREDVRVFPAHLSGMLPGRLRQHVFHSGLHSSLTRAIREEKPDLIHVQGNHLYAHTVYLACRGGPPLIQTAHDVRMVCPSETGIRKCGIVCEWSFGLVCRREGCVPLSKLAVQGPSRMIVRSLFGREGWYLVSPSRALGENFSHFGIAPVHIPNFVDARPFEGAREPSSSRKILFVGALYPSKGVKHLLSAMSLLREQAAAPALEIVGDGPERGLLECRATELGLVGVVTFRGNLGEEETREAYMTSRVLVLPSVVKENCPLVVLEAMAAGRPVVASRVGGVVELVRQGESGLLVPYGDPHALASALREILQDGDQADRMGRRGAETVRSEFTVKRHLESIIGLYERATGRNLCVSLPGWSGG